MSEISKGKKRPKKKKRDEEDKLRLSLRKKVSKLNLNVDDFECKILLMDDLINSQGII